MRISPESLNPPTRAEADIACISTFLFFKLFIKCSQKRNDIDTSLIFFHHSLFLPLFYTYFPKNLFPPLPRRFITCYFPDIPPCTLPHVADVQIQLDHPLSKDPFLTSVVLLVVRFPATVDSFHHFQSRIILACKHAK